MDLFDTLTWAKILVKTIFLDTPTLTVPGRTGYKFCIQEPCVRAYWGKNAVKHA
jgi:hypothetical protein